MSIKLPLGCTLVAISILATLFLSSGCENQQGVKVGDIPPRISDNDIHGEYVCLNRLKGKVVVIYFWANSCCGDSLKQLEPFYRQNKGKGLEMLAINELSSEKDVASYAKSYGLTFPMLTDEHSMLFKQYRAFGFPTIFILGRDGIIREKILGDIKSAKLEQLTSVYLDNRSQ